MPSALGQLVSVHNAIKNNNKWNLDSREKVTFYDTFSHTYIGFC